MGLWLQAHYMLGLALLQGKQYSAAIAELEKVWPQTVLPWSCHEQNHGVV